MDIYICIWMPKISALNSLICKISTWKFYWNITYHYWYINYILLQDIQANPFPLLALEKKKKKKRRKCLIMMVLEHWNTMSEGIRESSPIYCPFKSIWPLILPAPTHFVFLVFLSSDDFSVFLTLIIRKGYPHRCFHGRSMLQAAELTEDAPERRQ